MSVLALSLVLAAALLHATWNLLAKRAESGASFVWLFSLLSALLYAPLALYLLLIEGYQPQPIALLFLAGTALLHLAYFLLLQRAYGEGDLSLVYPLARGSGPALATLAAILLLGERPTPLALGGALLILLGVVVITSGTQTTGRNARRAVGFGLVVGVVIASYTLWDSYAVSVVLIPPLLLDYGSTLGRVFLLAPHARGNWGEVRAVWGKYRWEALGVAFLSPLAYILVLTALTFTPVSYVAPARELSILVATAMGGRLLSEGEAQRRLAAATAMVVGVVAMTLG